jgi:hypothetical protein
MVRRWLLAVPRVVATPTASEERIWRFCATPAEAPSAPSYGASGPALPHPEVPMAGCSGGSRGRYEPTPPRARRDER